VNRASDETASRFTLETGIETADYQAFAKDMAFTQWVSRSLERKTGQVLESASIREIRGHSHCRI